MTSKHVVDRPQPDPDAALRTEALYMLNRYSHEIAELRARRLAVQDLQFDSMLQRMATPDEAEHGQALLDGGPELQVAAVRAGIGLCYPNRSSRQEWYSRYYDLLPVGELVQRLLRRKLQYSEADVVWIAQRLAQVNEDWQLLSMAPISLRSVLRSIERWSRDHALSAEATDALATLHDNLRRGHLDSEAVRAVELLDTLLGHAAEEAWDARDDFGGALQQWLDAQPAASRSDWTEALARIGALPGARPTKTWLADIAALTEALGRDVFVANAIDWLALLHGPGRNSEYKRPDGYDYPSSYIADRNADLLKGLAWACSTISDERLPVALGDAALACYKKIPNIGARSTKAGNACVHALAASASMPAVAQLQRLAQRVKLASQRKQIDQALATAADELGLDAGDLDEISVQSHGLVDGRVTRTFGDFTAELTVTGSDSVDLHWRKPDGGVQKSVPAAVKREHASEVKALNRERKELREALAVQRMRLERLMLFERAWPLATWRERYLDHPLVSQFARRLIWAFETDDSTSLGCWLDGELVGPDDEPLGPLVPETQVRLWHPIESDAAGVLGWRDWLDRQQRTQPFKQAHREIYVLTDAERETATYSNRFAAHVLRQHQLNALCQERGWSYQLQGAWDSFNVPALELSEVGLRAEYWVEGIDAEDDSGLSHAYIYLYVSTDQVRFADAQSGASVSLDEVPPRVFSEVMRDVDLFVGVASVGADPHWLDGGPGRLEGYQGYWWDVSFGDLTARAEVRRDTLARLLPRMAKLTDRWTLDGRFLRVRGDLRSYKIHLGSGNILMEPNDEYLCIVPGRSASNTPRSDGLFLPFEGDQTLAVILSKALMLAEDTKINDPTIVRQIGRAA